MNKMIEMLKGLINSGKSPQEIAMQMLGNNSNPIFNNLVMMAQKGDYKGVENVARNIFKQQGRDLDKELAEIQSLFKK